jgi:hypothetical protein
VATTATNITGFDKVAARLAQLAERQVEATDSFLRGEAESILAESQQLVPRDVGDLARSGRVEKPGGRVSAGGVGRGLLPRDARGRFTEGGWQVVYGRDGSDVEAYVEAVHEHPSKHDPPTWQGKTVHFTTGGPQFLSTPYRKHLSTIWVRLAANIRANLR